MDSVIELRDLTKRFILSKKQRKINKTSEKLLTAVNQVSLKVYEGEIYGLLGPNGAGKTTALRLISTLIKPNEGQIFVAGIDALKEPLEVRRKIGFLTSELKLEEFFTPNFLYNFYSDLHGVDPDTREKRKKMLFDRFDVTDFKEVKVGDLSSGMKQKASLAISLAHDPKIIIFDEPTNGLDVLVAKIVIDFLLELKEQNYTMIISTHIFSLVERICDRVGIIVDGRLVLEDDVANLKEQGILEDVFFEIYQRESGEI
ncbi:MAG: ATP-binding cassette domain-containing protein [Acholeplasmataceae bacterium]|jgi:sodium transport system ATP-binding protein|nr:ATP-binding cassette domain-containing protein [Acholeplasmataceae bacterium]